jgi:hypothetical protein
MKNIHLIPTDKPSRLYKDDSQVLNLNIHSLIKGIFTNGVGSNQHIYITSSEEIKEGDWFINTSLNKPYQADASDVHVSLINEKKYCKKITLTDNKDLIKDGVQAIDNEFLEWFVKNPSCEWVEVEKTFVTNSGLGYQEYAILDSDFKVLEVVANRPQSSYKIGEVTELDGYEYITEYKIIIPQEEPKQETSNEVKKRAKNYMKLKDALNNKQETLEEAAERLIINPTLEDKQVFESGANWQAERMYSDIELFTEELKDKIDSFEYSVNKNSYISDYIKDWFEQFKKK